MTNTTRIEVRFIGKKVPIHHLSEYECLKELNLFNHLQAKYLSKKKWRLVREDLTIKKVQLIEKFFDEVEREGVHSARRKFNRNRDFSRSIEPILKNCSVDLKLSKRWKKKIETRIVKDLEIKKYLKLKVKMEMENEKNKIG